MGAVTDERDEQESTCPVKAAASASFLQGMEKMTLYGQPFKYF